MYPNYFQVTVRSPVLRLKRWRLFIIGVIIFLLSSNTLFAQAIIDETMPASIPSEIIKDWEDQDKPGTNYKAAAEKIAETLTDEAFAKAIKDKASTAEAKQLYYEACHYRRVEKMRDYAEDIQKLVYAKHHNLGNLIVGCQEGYSFPNIDEKWSAGSALYYLEFKDYYPEPKTLLEDKTGILRDPCVSLDGKRLAFAWSKDAGSGSGWSARGKGYKIYELDIDKSLKDNKTTPRQITSNPPGLEVSDYEPCYTQLGDIIFNSSRCFQLIDCYINMVSTFFICDTAGRYLRRVGYDQVHTFYPQLKSDGKIMYTRWEYNDRGLMNSMGVFDMYPDGTHQNEVYGNQTQWPVTTIHAREIPYSNGKVMAIASGHHAPYYGEPLIIDPNIDRNGLKPIKFVAPVRTYTKNPNVSMDSGGVEFKFSHPMPLDEENFLVSWTPTAKGAMKLYFMDINGKRELIAWGDKSVSQPYPVKAREVSTPRIFTDYTKKTAIFKMEDVSVGIGLGKSIPKGTVKKLRVVQLEYRASSPDANPDANFGRTGDMGWVYVPIARHTGSWQVKRILGETPVYSDGSAAFTVPAEVPLFFQCIDSAGRMVQTMRSWSTLMPGETFNCIGCHENKNEAVTPKERTEAGDAKPLEPFYDISGKLFSYPDIIQPILDKNCVSCHKSGGTGGSKIDLSSGWVTLTDDDHKESKKKWMNSYVNLTKGGGMFSGGTYINWLSIFSSNEAIQPRTVGSYRSKLITTILPAHKTSGKVELTKEEMDKILAWIDLCVPHCGRYNQGMISATDSAAYEKALAYRTKHIELERKNVEEFVKAGQWGQVSVKPENNRISGNISASKIQLRFLAGERKLLLVPSSIGELRINDLLGRQMVKVKIDKKNIGTSMSILLPESISRGVYVARLSGSDGIQTKIISIYQ